MVASVKTADVYRFSTDRKTRGRQRACVTPFLFLLVSTAAAANAASPADGLFYERTLMARADQRCHLFAPAVAHALAAARDQARGAALRAGDGADAVSATEQRALARADAVDCRAAGLKTAAARLRQAFAGYAQMAVMRFPGPRSAWLAERPDVRLKGSRWRLVEALPGSGGWILFGAVDGAPALLDARRGAMPASGARLTLRNPALWNTPVPAAGPPAGASRSFIAQSRGPAPTTLLPAGARGGQLYRFPPQALDALAALDPRENARLELVYPAAGRERIVTAPLEIGDLAAARAFLAAGAR